jgi:(1->4)-alpha-D-glucan 1-alpha-D-glucosylmutase
VPLVADGPRSRHIVAFARMLGEEAVVTVACRLPLSMLTEAQAVGQAEFWGDTSVALPDGLVEVCWRDALTDRAICAGAKLLMREVLNGQTVAILSAERT